MTIHTTARGRVGSRGTFSFSGSQHGKISFMDKRRFTDGQDVQIKFNRRKVTISARLEQPNKNAFAIVKRIKGSSRNEPRPQSRLVIKTIDGQPVLRTTIPVTLGNDGTSVTVHFPSSQRSKAA